MCKNMTSKLFILPFFFIIIFLNRQGYCPCSYVSPGAMRKLDIRSSLIWILMFLFERFILNANKKSLRCWTLKQHFNSFEEAKRTVKALDRQTILSVIWWKEARLWIDFFILSVRLSSNRSLVSWNWVFFSMTGKK